MAGTIDNFCERKAQETDAIIVVFRLNLDRPVSREEAELVVGYMDSEFSQISDEVSQKSGVGIKSWVAGL